MGLCIYGVVLRNVTPFKCHVLSSFSVSGVNVQIVFIHPSD